jgi:hypothetical protein
MTLEQTLLVIATRDFDFVLDQDSTFEHVASALAGCIGDGATTADQYMDNAVSFIETLGVMILCELGGIERMLVNVAPGARADRLVRIKNALTALYRAESQIDRERFFYLVSQEWEMLTTEQSPF